MHTKKEEKIIGYFRGTPYTHIKAGEPCFTSKQICEFFGWSMSKLNKMKGLARKGVIDFIVKQEEPKAPCLYPCEDAYKFYRNL